jgi:hypothetical protein
VLASLTAFLFAAQAAQGPVRQLAAVSGPAGDQIAFFTDRASIRRMGAVVFVDEYMERERADPNGIISALVNMEYDCRLRTERLLAVQFVDAQGENILVSDPRDSVPVPLDSPDYDRLRFACGETRGMGLVRDDLRQTALRLFDGRARLMRAYPEASARH